MNLIQPTGVQPQEWNWAGHCTFPENTPDAAALSLLLPTGQISHGLSISCIVNNVNELKLGLADLHP